MSEGVKLWCFLLLIPFFLAIGHDLYANYYKNEENRARLEAFEIDPSGYQGSDLGYLFVTYTPGLYEKSRGAIGETAWVAFFDPVLRLYTFVVALIPATLFFIWLLISRIFDIWPFTEISGGRGQRPGPRRHKQPDPLDRRGAQPQFKYKRR
jgi:hypothetical protein